MRFNCSASGSTKYLDRRNPTENVINNNPFVHTDLCIILVQIISFRRSRYLWFSPGFLLYDANKFISNFFSLKLILNSFHLFLSNGMPFRLMVSFLRFDLPLVAVASILQPHNFILSGGVSISPSGILLSPHFITVSNAFSNGFL